MAALPLVAEDRGISVEEVRDWSSNMLWPVEVRAGRPAAGSLLQTSSCLRPPGQCQRERLSFLLPPTAVQASPQVVSLERG